MLSESKYSALNIDAKRLSDKVMSLRSWSNFLLVIRLLLLLILPIHVFLLNNYIINANEMVDKPTIICTFSVYWVEFFVLSFLNGYILRKKLIPKYLEAQRDWDSLSDKVDWTEMRKKQLYNPLDKKMQKPIDDFSRYRRSILCPYNNSYGTKIVWRVWGWLYSIELYACPVITLIMIL